MASLRDRAMNALGPLGVLGPAPCGGTGRVLVLGDEARATLTVVRSLGRQGIDVTLGVLDPTADVTFSRFVNRVVTLPDLETKGWVAALKELLSSRPVDLVIPTSDESLVPIVEHRRELEPLARLAVPEDRGYRLAYLKHETFAMARAFDVPIPATWTLVTREDLARALEDPALALPVIIKPGSSKVWRAGRCVELKVTLARDRGTLVGDVERLLPLTPVLLQTFSPGLGTGQEFLVQKGRIVSAFQHDRVHEPLNGGGSSYRRSVPLDEEMLACSRRMLEHMQWTGVAMVEYKRDPSTGRFVLMEINGRFWGSLPLAVAAGVDFPFQLYELLVHGKEPVRRPYRLNCHGRNVERDFKWYIENWRADRADPFLITMPRSRPIGELRHLVCGRERWDTLTFDDPRPFVPAVGRIARWVGGSVMRRAYAEVATLRLWRQREGRRLARLVKRRGHILFVCRGNICRSPFAEGYARLALSSRSGGGLEISSAGTFPKEGRTCPAEACAAARELGIDLEGHRSRHVSAELVEQASAIICMDEKDRTLLTEAFPGIGKRLFFLGTFEPSGRHEIPDPWGRPVEAFRGCYRRVAAGIDGLLPLIDPCLSGSCPRPENQPPGRQERQS